MFSVADDSWVDVLAHLRDRRIISTIIEQSADVKSDEEGDEESLGVMLKRAEKASVGAVICAGTNPLMDDDLMDTRQAYKLVSAEEIPRVFQAFGLHPAFISTAASVGDTSTPYAAQLQQLHHLLNTASSVVAVGEIGFDGRAGMPDLNLQRIVFLEQLEVAASLDLPVIIHCVQAPGALVDALRSTGKKNIRGVMHGFCGSVQMVETLLDYGLYFSIGASALKPGAKRCEAVAEMIPNNRLLLESDCPDQLLESLRPKRPSGLSEVADVPVIAGELAALRGQELEQLKTLQNHNARALFSS